MWNNKVYVFGGDKATKQISKLTNCRLDRAGKLSFEFDFGSCAIGRDYLYLCFGRKEQIGKECHRSTGPLEEFTTAESFESIFDHQNTQIAASESKTDNLKALVSSFDHRIH